MIRRFRTGKLRQKRRKYNSESRAVCPRGFYLVRIGCADVARVVLWWRSFGAMIALRWRSEEFGWRLITVHWPFWAQGGVCLICSPRISLRLTAFRHSESFCLICPPRVSSTLAAFRYSESFCLICSPRISLRLTAFRYSNKSYKKSSKLFW